LEQSWQKFRENQELMRKNKTTYVPPGVELSGTGSSAAENKTT
jgi:hypothetical protein